MSTYLTTKLPRDGTHITLLTDCGYASAGSTFEVSYYGRRTIELRNVRTGSSTQVTPWQLEAAHFNSRVEA